MSVTHSHPIAPASSIVPAITPIPHPTPCPSWCKDRAESIQHRFGPTCTFHWSPRYAVSNPRPLDEESAVLTAELAVGDEYGEFGNTTLYVQGMTDVDLSPAEADVFIAQMQAFVDTLRVLRRQMG